MAQQKTAVKKGEISDANARVLIIVSVATLLVVFCLMGAKSMLGKALYQSRVITAQQAAVRQLASNKNSTQTLLNQYNNVFIGTDPTNIIGGSNTTTASTMPPDGDNGRIVLDALPISYDYPGLVSSVSKLLGNDGISSPNISGTDDSASANNNPAASPQAVPISLTISGNGTYTNVQSFIKDLERSIRPFDVKSMQLNGNNGSMSFAISVTTYYQVAKTLDAGSREIK